MSTVMIQIRNVPSDLHRKLKARAALAGMALSDYLLRELEHTLARPTREELRARLSTRAPVTTGPSSVELIREARATGGRSGRH